MDILTSAAMAAWGVVVGVLSGITGMGGILIPPFMIALLGLTPHLAMGTSLASFLPAFLLAMRMHHRQGNFRWNLAGPLAGAGAVCVFIGTELKALAPGAVLNIFLAALVIVVGAMTLRLPAAGEKNEANGAADAAAKDEAADGGVSETGAAANATAGATTKDGAAGANGAAAMPVNAPDAANAGTPGGRTNRAEAIRLAVVGGAVGVISGLTGAGGSVLTVPIMILMGYAPLTAVVSGVAYVTAVSAVGTVGNALHGDVDFALAGLCALGQIAGIRAGIAVAGRMNARVMRLLVAWVCVLTGIGILAKTLL